jgi:SPP1 gp7 family putative phage head morphogenesis protein
MTTNIDSIKSLVSWLGAREASIIVNLSKRQQTLEDKWVVAMASHFSDVTEELFAHALRTGRLSFVDVDFGRLLLDHAHATMEDGIRSTDVKTPIRGAMLAAPPPGKVPRSLKALREWWDKYRKGKLPPRQRALGKRIKDEYVKQVQAAWLKHSTDFLSGDAFRNTAAIEAIQRRADVAFSRAKMIVETETTYYFNKTRREVYDESDDVTHYLFVAIRDHATTKWCKTRHGLVYAKTDPLLDKETPPIHWNCRSEVLPLVRQNPSHLRLIHDAKRQRRTNRCEPLPPGWTGRAKSS